MDGGFKPLSIFFGGGWDIARLTRENFQGIVTNEFEATEETVQTTRHPAALPVLIWALWLLAALAACAGEKARQAVGKDAGPGATADSAEDPEAIRRAELEERIVASPMLITSDYFRSTAGAGQSLRLFGPSPKEKDLEERLARLEERLMGLPERAKDQGGLPVLRRKVVLLSLLGDLGLDVLSLLPAALRRTEGLVPVDASQLSRLLEERGESVADLASSAVRREIASLAGIHAYILVYFPETFGPAPRSDLRLDVIHAGESVLIGSYLARLDQFEEVAPKISEDVVRGTEWSCRIIKTEEGKVYLNSGRLSGLRPGDRLRVYGRGRELVDPVTRRSLGLAPGELKGEIVVEHLFGTDAAEASAVSGGSFETGDVATMARLA